MKSGWYSSLVITAVLLLQGCVVKPVMTEYTALDPQLERESVYIMPFDATLVPPDFSEPIFNQFVDILNSRRKQTKVGRFVIMKEELKEIEPVWLIKQVYISGDIWGYVEKSGCCSTEMKAKSRIYLYEPGKKSQTFDVFVPVEHYFDHDRGSITTEKERLGKKLAQDLADSIIRKLTP